MGVCMDCEQCGKLELEGMVFKNVNGRYLCKTCSDIEIMLGNVPTSSSCCGRGDGCSRPQR